MVLNHPILLLGYAFRRHGLPTQGGRVLRGKNLAMYVNRFNRLRFVDA